MITLFSDIFLDNSDLFTKICQAKCLCATRKYTIYKIWIHVPYSEFNFNSNLSVKNSYTHPDFCIFPHLQTEVNICPTTLKVTTSWGGSRCMKVLILLPGVNIGQSMIEKHLMWLSELDKGGLWDAPLTKGQQWRHWYKIELLCLCLCSCLSLHIYRVFF